MVIMGAALASLAASSANAAVIVNIAQVGSDVLITTTGTLDTTGLSEAAPFPYRLDAALIPKQGYLATGVANASLTGYSGISGAAAFGMGSRTDATSSSGDGFGLNSGLLVFVPRDYISGSALISQARFAGQTLASLGLANGRYRYAAPNDVITVNIGSAVPEPATWAMMLVGFGAMGFAMRRRRQGVLAPRAA